MSLEGSLKKGLLVFVAITPNQKYLLLFALFPCTSLVPVEGRIAHGGAAVPRAGNIPFAASADAERGAQCYRFCCCALQNDQVCSRGSSS